MLEKQIEQPVVNWAKKNNVKVKKKIFGEQLDRWFFFPNGHLFIIEFKAPGKKLTPLQQVEIEELHKLGFDVEVHDEKEAAIAALNKRRILAASFMLGKVDTPQIPERFRSVAINSRLRGAVRRSRDGQNFHHAGRVKRS